MCISLSWRKADVVPVSKKDGIILELNYRSIIILYYFPGREISKWHGMTTKEKEIKIEHM
jgi:hypothetical protein